MSIKCEKCGTEKIVVEECVTGFPDYRVAGSRVEYCYVCDEIPIVELNTNLRSFMLELK